MKNNEIMFSINRLAVSIDKYANTCLKPFGLTFKQLSVLIFLADNQARSLNQKDISKEFDISHATTVGIVARMQERSLVRVQACDTDRRITNVAITQHGLDVLEQTKAVQDKLVLLFSSCFDETAMVDFFTNVNKINQAFKA